MDLISREFLVYTDHQSLGSKSRWIECLQGGLLGEVKLCYQAQIGHNQQSGRRLEQESQPTGEAECGRVLKL